jgi:trimethylamine--corrinoid protein Co-methyltransferase
MRSGAPAFADIGCSISNVIFNQMWRRYGLPISNGTPGYASSKSIDYQTGYEKALGAIISAVSGAHTICFHGGISGELTAHPVQAVLDDDVAGMVGRFVEGVEISAETIALELIEEVGPVPGHYLNKAHTREWWKNEQYVPAVADRLSYPEWIKEGKKRAIDYAKERMEEILASHKPTPLTPEQEEAVQEILKEAREYYRKKGLISHAEWVEYSRVLEVAS